MNAARKVQFYAVGGSQTLFGLVQNRLHLFVGHAGEPM